MPTNNTSPEHAQLQQPFPFMRLPPELRALVYLFALQHLFDDVEKITQYNHHLPTQGALEVLRIRELRWESIAAMRGPARAYQKRLDALWSAQLDDLQKHGRSSQDNHAIHSRSLVMRIVYYTILKAYSEAEMENLRRIASLLGR